MLNSVGVWLGNVIIFFNYLYILLVVIKDFDFEYVRYSWYLFLSDV